MSEEARAAGSQAVCARVRAIEAWKRARCVLLYVPMAGEVDVSPLIKEAWDTGKQVVVPRVKTWESTASAARVDIVCLNGWEELQTSRHGVRQPGPDAEAIAGASLELGIVPGLAFDRLCRRLGRGGGFYDEMLGKLARDGLDRSAKNADPVRWVGVCFDEQIVTEVPTERGDMQMDVVCTPSSIFMETGS
jgi:5-formyltetrahydrofolate cyclo-ligase